VEEPVDGLVGAKRLTAKWRYPMKEDLAAANVNRAYTLSAMSFAIFTFMLFFLYPRYSGGTINPVLFQVTLVAMGIATFSLVFASFHYYRCALSGRMNEAERIVCARQADGFWLLGYTMMFLVPSLILFLVELFIPASVWLALWLAYLLFVIRSFPKVQTPMAPQ
jgi:hypothetical protein